MLSATRLRQLAPYVVTLIAGVALYAVADRIAYPEVPGQIGPDLWPKLVIGLMIGVSIFEIARRLFSRSEPAGAPRAEPIVPYEDDLPDTPWMVFGAVAVTVVYLLSLSVVGFTLGTLVYVACLIWFGGTRRPWLVAFMSVAITGVFAFVFMKLIFVALPVGTAPFSAVSFAVMKLFGV